ncbi:MAG TPA: hypothetical protein VN641_01325 [Urbifossiella sp.]|nr:hypothetical protein [Urbifossiella sp.]
MTKNQIADLLQRRHWIIRLEDGPFSGDQLIVEFRAIDYGLKGDKKYYETYTFSPSLQSHLDELEEPPVPSVPYDKVVNKRKGKLEAIGDRIVEKIHEHAIWRIQSILADKGLHDAKIDSLLREWNFIHYEFICLEDCNDRNYVDDPLRPMLKWVKAMRDFWQSRCLSNAVETVISELSGHYARTRKRPRLHRPVGRKPRDPKIVKRVKKLHEAKVPDEVIQVDPIRWARLGWFLVSFSGTSQGLAGWCREGLLPG